LLTAVALLIGAGTTAVAQSANGSLTGKLTDLYSTPLDKVAVVLRNEASGAETRTITAKNGVYRFTQLSAGEYTLLAESPHLGRGQIGGLVVPAGHEARVQTAMQFEPLPARPIQIALHAIAPESPAVTAEIAVEPLQTLPLSGRRWLGVTRETLTTVAPEIAPAREEARIDLAFSGTGLSALGGAGQRGLEQAWAGGSGLALIEAAVHAAQAAIAAAPLLPKPLLADLQEPDPISPAITTTLSAEQLQTLPVNGRRWQDFVLETASTPAGGAAEAAPDSAAKEPAATTVDGVNTTLAFGEAGPEGSSVSLRRSSMSEMAIRTVRTVAGGALNVETQRGGNGLHGQGFLFDRQNAWGARNPFTQWVKETAPATEITTPVFTPEPYTPADRELTWGLGLGSRIRRDKLFWFAAVDSNQRNDPGLATVKHPYMFFAQPTNDQMQVLSARLGLSSANPVVEGLAAYSKMLETLDGLLGPAPRTAAQWTGFARIDWAAAERHRFTLESASGLWDAPGGGLSRVSGTYGSHSFGSSHASEEWLLGRWEAFLTPNLLAVTQGSAGRAIVSARPETPSAYEQTLLRPNVWGQLPQIAVDARYGFTFGNPSRFGAGSSPDERLYQGQETVDWVRGGWLVKAGLTMAHNADATSLLRNQTGTYSYASVENFASDALAFAAFGISGQFNPDDQHNCDQTGKVWRDSAGTLRGLGSLPCYSYYTQTLGPTNWSLSTNDWAGYATAQWQPKKRLTLSAGLRWEREQLPPPIAALANAELPQTAKLPDLGNDWAPRVSLALGGGESHWPVLRLGYGLFYGRTQNAVVETALTQTGSLKGDLNFFLRSTDNLNAGGAPPFPYVLAGEPGSVVKPGAVAFAPGFRNPEVHQGVAAIEEALPGHVVLTASALVSLGRRLPISIDTNFDSKVNPGTITYGVVDGTGKGPIKTAQITVPFYASWPSATSATGFAGRLNPNYQQITEILSRANSTYEAALLKVTRNGRNGLSLHAHYTYAHAMDWNPNESTQMAGNDVLDPASFSQEYGTSDLDVRHAAAAMVTWEAPWKLRNRAARLGNGWMLSGIGQFRSGLPFTMRTSGSLAEEFNQKTGAAIVGLGPGMNGSGGDNRVYGVGRNTFRSPSTWKADVRLGKRFDLGHMRQLELLAESFNLFNHQNVTELETTGYFLASGSLSGGLPTLNFLTGLKANTTAFGQPLNINATNFYRERQMQLGLRMRF
jgi:hypothetical protein